MTPVSQPALPRSPGYKTRRRARHRQVFGLTGVWNSYLPQLPTRLRGQCCQSAFVPAHRCGAAPVLHRIPFWITARLAANRQLHPSIWVLPPVVQQNVATKRRPPLFQGRPRTKWVLELDISFGCLQPGDRSSPRTLRICRWREYRPRSCPPGYPPRLST